MVGNGGLVATNDRQRTLGEMTLELFLDKVGVVWGSGTGGQHGRHCPWTDEPRIAGAPAWPNDVPVGTGKQHVPGDV